METPHMPRPVVAFEIKQAENDPFHLIAILKNKSLQPILARIDSKITMFVSKTPQENPIPYEMRTGANEELVIDFDVIDILSSRDFTLEELAHEDIRTYRGDTIAEMKNFASKHPNESKHLLRFDLTVLFRGPGLPLDAESIVKSYYFDFETVKLVEELSSEA